MTNNECGFRSLIVCLKNDAKKSLQNLAPNFSNQCEPNLNGLAIGNNQSRTSSEHFDPPLFQNPYTIMAEAESNHSLSLNLVNRRTSITYYVQLRFSTSSPWNISHLTKVEENWPSKITFK